MLSGDDLPLSGSPAVLPSIAEPILTTNPMPASLQPHTISDRSLFETGSIVRGLSADTKVTSGAAHQVTALHALKIMGLTLPLKVITLALRLLPARQNSSPTIGSPSRVNPTTAFRPSYVLWSHILNQSQPHRPTTRHV